MAAALDRPSTPLTRTDQPDRASDIVKALTVTAPVAHFRVTGIRPTVRSLQEIFVRAAGREHALAAAVGYSGMLVVRLPRPTSGVPSTKICDHAWGTAIDFNINDGEQPGNTGRTIPSRIAKLVPYFNDAGWLFEIAFYDDMHFEAAEETVKQWSNDGAFG